VQNPDKLRVSPAAEELAMLVYDYTAAFPREERFGLALQMRRAVVSIGSNIFEGSGRGSNKAFASSLAVAHAETSELLFQVRLALKREFGDPTLGRTVKRRGENMRRMLFNLIRRVAAST
jgi:four helix bundle protein